MRLAGGAVEVFTARLEEPAPVLGRLAALLCEAERERAARLRFERDRRRFVVTRARLRQLLAARLGMRPEAVPLEQGPGGKPRLARRLSEVRIAFNVSNSEELAVYALSRAGEVGVDVEAIRPVPEADDIAAHTFSAREHAAYRGSSDRVVAFLREWTRKEAFLKATGAGWGTHLESADLSAPGARAGWRIQNFRPCRGYLAAVACRSS